MTPTLDKTRRELLDKGLLIGHAERDPEIIRRQRIDLVDLGAQRLATEIAVRVPDDLQGRMQRLWTLATAAAFSASSAPNM